MTHELKTHPEFFQAVIDGRKPFEIRKNDRGFKENDRLLLVEWNPESEAYSGRSALVLVTYVAHLERFGMNSLVAMTIKIEEKAA